MILNKFEQFWILKKGISWQVCTFGVQCLASICCSRDKIWYQKSVFFNIFLLASFAFDIFNKHFITFLTQYRICTYWQTMHLSISLSLNFDLDIKNCPRFFIYVFSWLIILILKHVWWRFIWNYNSCTILKTCLWPFPINRSQ